MATLRKIGITERTAIFVGLTLFGILSGFLIALSGYLEGAYMLNPLGAFLGEEIYICSIDHFGDPHSAFAHYTIPWILRTPQVCLFTSAIVWGLIGFLAQLIYNLVKKPPTVTKGVPTLIMTVSLIALLVLSAGIVYATQDESERQEPTQPTAFRVMDVGTPQTPEWETITTYEIESLSLSSKVIEPGHEFFVTGVVKNTGSKRGTAKVELKVDGHALSFHEVGLLPGESKSVQFVVLVPKEGTYTVNMGNLSEDFEVK